MTVRDEKEAMIQNVRQSTSSALEALEQLRRSLVQARFSESSDAYRTMCDTLLGQRIWTMDKEDEVVERNFGQLRKEAAEIKGILEPYVRSFEKLERLPVDPSVLTSPEPKCESQSPPERLFLVTLSYQL